MSSGSRYVVPYATAFDTTGIVSPGAYLNFYISGTDTPKDTYSNIGLTIPNSNPVQANGAGLFPSIFMTGAAYKVVLTDSNGDEIWTADPVYGSGVASATEGFNFTTTEVLLSAFGGGITLVNGTMATTAGRTVEGDGGGSEFYYISSDSTTPDNGGTVRVDGQGRRWFSTLQNPTPLLFGAKGNAIAISDANITTDTLSSAKYSFAASDVGKTIGVRGAGVAGVTLVTTIASLSGSNAVLTTPASTAVTGAAACFGTDDAAALQSFISALPTKVCSLGSYKYLSTQQLKFCQNDTAAAGFYGTPGAFDAYDASYWTTAIFFLLGSSTTDAVTDDVGIGSFNPRPMTFRDVGFCMYGTGRDGVVVTIAKNPYWANVAILFSGRDGLSFAPKITNQFVEKGVYINVTPFDNGRNGFSFTTAVDTNYISEMSFYGCEVRGVGVGGAPIFGETTGGTFASGTQISDITWVSFAPNLEDAAEVSALCGIRLVGAAGKSNIFGRWKFLNCGMENTFPHATPLPWINEDSNIIGDGWFVEPASFFSNYTPYSNGYVSVSVNPAYDGIATLSGMSDTNSGTIINRLVPQANGDAVYLWDIPGNGNALLEYKRASVLKAQIVFNQMGQGFFDYETSLNIRYGANGTPVLSLGNAQLAFFNGGLASKATVTGSRGGNAALASLLTALAGYGLIVDSSS